MPLPWSAPALRACRIPALALVLAAGAQAALVTLDPPGGALKPGRELAFRSAVTGTGGRDRCLWLVLEQGADVTRSPGVLLKVAADGRSATLAATPGARPRTLTVRATAQAAPEAFREAQVLVEPVLGVETKGLPASPAASGDSIGHHVSLIPEGDHERADSKDGQFPGLPEGKAEARGGLPHPLADLVLDFIDARADERQADLLRDPRPSRLKERAQGHDAYMDKDLQDSPVGLLDTNGRQQTHPLVGYDCPAVFRWDAPWQGTFQRLATAPARELDSKGGIRLEALDDRAQQTERRFTESVDSVTVETVAPLSEGKGWRSTQAMARPDVRGLVPVAGDPEARPSHQDGRGAAARFSAPQGIAPLDGGDPDPWDGKSGLGHAGMRLCAVADAGDHVLRIVYRDHMVKTIWGKPGEPGFEDGAFGEARFREPGFLARVVSRPQTSGRWWRVDDLYVSDTGNHAVRLARYDGVVSTVAGTGQPGYQDGEAKAARFNRPRGIAALPGRVFVADAGNHAIRCIDLKNGKVHTVAGGGPGQRGTSDGVGAEARFTDLKGLAMDDKGATLYAVDGHAIREITLDEHLTGTVTTRLGRVDQAMERKDFQARVTLVPGARLEPCLDDPQGIVWDAGRLHIADRGSHLIRTLYLARTPESDGILATAAGDPTHGELACGRLRDRLDHRFPGQGYGTPGRPLGLALVRERHDSEEPHPVSLLVTSGTGLVKLGCLEDRSPITAETEERIAAGLALEAPAKVAAGQPFPVKLWIRGLHDQSHQPYDYLYTLECLEADDSRGCVREGRGQFHAWRERDEGRFARPGLGTLWLRITTPDGHSFDTERTVQVVENLWTGPDRESRVVPAWGEWSARRPPLAAAPGQRFRVECELDTEGLDPGRALIELQFTDARGRVLQADVPADAGTHERVDPGSARSRLSLERTAPDGTVQVQPRLRVLNGTPGAEVTFDQVLFHRLP